jgi:HEAT repeat protein
MVNYAKNRLLTRGTVPGLIACLKDPDEQVRYRACEALGTLGQEAKEAVPALKELTTDGPQLVRGAAAEALRRIEKN